MKIWWIKGDDMGSLPEKKNRIERTFQVLNNFTSYLTLSGRTIPKAMWWKFHRSVLNVRNSYPYNKTEEYKHSPRKAEGCPFLLNTNPILSWRLMIFSTKSRHSASQRQRLHLPDVYCSSTGMLKLCIRFVHRFFEPIIDFQTPITWSFTSRRRDFTLLR
jgi:hypothetical protein